MTVGGEAKVKNLDSLHFWLLHTLLNWCHCPLHECPFNAPWFMGCGM